jgi:hypothetical protein
VGVLERFSAGEFERCTLFFWSVNMNAKTLCVAVTAVLFVVLAGGSLSAAVVKLANTYDLSETADATWKCYCAPTAAADVVYHFGNTYPSLLQGYPYGPIGVHPAADTDANDIIGDGIPVNIADPGDLPPGNGPPAGTLANRMSTTRAAGTTLLNLTSGLHSYLTANSTVGWNTQEVLAANETAPQGTNFLTELENDISGGADVILVVAWQGKPPVGGGYTVPGNYDNGTIDTSTIGHAFELIGYDSANIGSIYVNDPADNPGGTHSWVAQGQNYNVSLANLQFNVGGATAVAYGAVVVKPTPEPSTLVLLASGAAIGLGIALGYACRRGRRR